MVSADPCAIHVSNGDSSIYDNNENGVNRTVWDIFRADPDLVREHLPLGLTVTKDRLKIPCLG